MKLLVNMSALWLPATILGAAAASAVDLIARAATYHPPAGNIATVALAVLLAAPVSAVVGLGLAVATLPLVLLAVWLEGGSADERSRLVRRVMGPCGRFPITPLLVVAGGVGAELVRGSIVGALGLTHAAVTIGGAGIFAAGCGVGALGYRLLVWRMPKIAAPYPLLFTMIAGCIYYAADVYGELAAPYVMWPWLVSLSVVLAFAVGSLVTRHGVPRRAVAVPSTFTVICGLVLLAAYPSDGAAHAAWMQRSLFGLGAKDILATVTDLDGDGYSSLLGDGDCAALDPNIYPLAKEIVGNGVDDNCGGGDLVDFVAPPTKLPRVDARRSSRPDVFLITVDTLRADHVGRTIDGRPLTPTFDALSEQLSFPRAYSTSSHTNESIPAIMTGTYPANWHQFGIYVGVERTLAEILGVAGYDTSAITAFPWLLVALIHGFRYVDNSIGEGILRDEQTLTGPETTRLALEYLDQRDAAKPIFQWVHYFDPHAPYLRYPQLDDWLGADFYAAEVHLTDVAVGRYLQGLDARGLLDGSIVILVSDHGEGLGEHGIQTHVWGLYESIVRVPLMLRLPGVAPREVDVPVSIVDIFPTLIEFLGLRGILARDGRSLLPLLFVEGAERHHGPVFASVEDDGVPIASTIVDGPMKLTRNHRRASWELFDVVADPTESTNLVSERRGEFERLRDMLETHRDRAFNDVLLERKEVMWGARKTWKPETYVTKKRDDPRASPDR